MDLKIYQHQMWLTVKNYLSLLASKTEENENNNVVNMELRNLLKQIVDINERQKTVLSNMRRERDLVPCIDGAIQQNEGKFLPLATSEECQDEEAVNFASYASAGGVGEEDHDRIVEYDETSTTNGNKYHSENCADFLNELQSLSASYWEETQDLVTPEEFMHSLGLLTLRECDDVIEKRKDRHRRNGHTHIFCPSIWEKQETKRKRRDWLVSGSPPQLRRKIRPNSEPSSRQASRGASPVESSRSSSSLSPPSTSSPSSSPNHSIHPKETCPLCQRKDANLQCDGCGIYYHVTCVDFSEESDSYLGWLCLKCESRGLRSSSYIDPIHQNLIKANDSRKPVLRR